MVNRITFNGFSKSFKLGSVRMLNIKSIDIPFVMAENKNNQLFSQSIKEWQKLQSLAIHKLSAEGVQVRCRPSAHHQPVKSALGSYSGLGISDEILSKAYQIFETQNVLDTGGRFICSEKNRNKVQLQLDKMNVLVSNKVILQACLTSIFNGHLNSILLSNKAFITKAIQGENTSSDLVFLSNHANVSIDRQAEQAHHIAYFLLMGAMPIIMKGIFEGGSNLKPLNYFFKIDGEQHQLAIGYEDYQSDLNYVPELNQWMEKLGQPKFHVIKFKPKFGYEKTLLNLDHSLSICPGEVQVTETNFSSQQLTVSKILSKFKPKGIACVIGNGLDRYSIKFIEQVFKHKIYLDVAEDPFISSALLTINSKGDQIILVSEKLSPENQKKLETHKIKVIKMPKNIAGMGSWQCILTPSIQQSEPISPEKWRDFLTQYGLIITDIFYQSVVERFESLSLKI